MNGKLKIAVSLLLVSCGRGVAQVLSVPSALPSAERGADVALASQLLARLARDLWPAYAQTATTAVARSDSRPATPSNALAKMATSVSVKAKEEALSPHNSTGTFYLTGKQLLESAGTWSDLPRYLQTLPGMINGSDTQNAFFVRGGNSFENLFLVDRIEVPNINHLALAGSTGGLGSMLDTEMIANVTFRSGDLDSSFDSHLSSLTNIHTLDLPERTIYALDLGYSGAGFRVNRTIGGNKTLLLSARESITNLFIRDIGLNGSPELTNSLIKYTVDLSAADHIWVDSLSGRDRLKVRPASNDRWETNPFNTDYSGWRNTTGVVWQHTHRAEGVSTWLLSNTQSKQNLSQIGQLQNSPSIFQQENGDGTTEAKYDFQYADENGSGSNMGLDLHQNRINYKLQQADGIYSPYSASTLPLAALAASPDFSTTDQAVYFDLAQLAARKLYLKAGTRLQRWGMQSAQTPPVAFLPHASLSFALSQRLNFRASYRKAEQLPPYAVLASVPSNLSLSPISSQQFVAGGTLKLGDLLTVDVEAYHKTYAHYPVAADFPQVSLATILPVITEPFVALQMQSKGFGVARGVEVSITQAPRHHVFTRANLTGSHAAFTGRDGIYRTSTNDLPMVLNVMTGFQAGGYTVTLRDTMTSGRVYTPIMTQASYNQNRAIYDLARINTLRGPLYNRLDFAVNRSFPVRGGMVRLHGGLINVLNHNNFLEYLWRPRCPVCGPIAEHQMGLQPDINVSYAF